MLIVLGREEKIQEIQKIQENTWKKINIIHHPTTQR